ncbi:hypothetical protein CNMCM8980_004978 [Aspergillus fumigatiaffinis]|uniref:PBP domain-containing protein n=1 Tax=Aspergillus fumigatiaffinis TaxID=340414 RepID=A0A8H4HDE7_9EURO|nr:hypothetical protein CNMCM5878_004390 [Aspergillus fumigatiaffinis]KAF4236050.1 hypothetical protein CNMCM6457_002657 [Aspergillus fumigatiaffinis]KAF4240865.1 hypothetical protein CNMCM6805_004669 [Aspergillus fumigatiaffinis]KAF4248858.1 hypothetical protein CNMCM8980_004978 [Aspergillus fumigatiaffinis]
MASLFNVIFSISQRISQYQLTMQFLGAFSLLGFLAGLAVAAYNDACPSCTEIYDGGCDKDSGTVEILIGNGGAGQSGLAKALADSFIQKQTNNCRANIFKIGWVKGDPTKTINNLKAGHVHVGITYHKVAEQIAIDTGFAKGCMYEDDSKHPCFTDCKNVTEKPCYTFRDHFYLVGPRENPADVKKDDNIMNTFKKIYETGERGKARFLTRFDKSATNIKDSEMWIGQRGENHEELLNRGGIKTSRNIQASHRSYVEDFVKWVHGPDGQRVIRNYHKSPKNYCFYKGFPTDGHSLEPDNCTWDLGVRKACAAHDNGDERGDL